MPAYEPAGFPNPISNVPGKRTFHLEVVYTAGAPLSYWGKDLTVADTATGKITVTFPRTFRKLTGFRWGWSSLAAGAVYFPVILTDAIATASSTGGGTLVIETRTEAGVATDPASGDKLLLEFEVSNDALIDDYDRSI